MSLKFHPSRKRSFWIWPYGHHTIGNMLFIVGDLLYMLFIIIIILLLLLFLLFDVFKHENTFGWNAENVFFIQYYILTVI